MNWPARLERLEAVVSHAVPQVAVRSLRLLPPTTAGGLQILYNVELSDDRMLLLKLPPPLMLRLLRWEHNLILSEPCVITWIFTEIFERSRAPNPRIPMQSSVTPNTQTGFTPFQAANMMSMDQEPSSATPGDPLLSYLPAVITSSTFNDKLGSPFSLWEPAIGCAISSLAEPLTPPERRTVDYQKGHLIRLISQFRAPNSRFGPAIAVLGGAPPPYYANMDGNGGLPVPTSSVGSGSVATWSTAFLALMENIIRDGEDLTININYSRIRSHMDRLSYALDDVMEPRLVLFDAGSDDNVLVTRSTKRAQIENGSSRTAHTNNGSPQERSLLTGGSSSSSCKECATSYNVKRVGETTGIQGAVDSIRPIRISVTGLQDWSNCLFGDPLMVKAFNQSPSDDFLRGFRGQPPGYPSSSTAEMPRDIPAAKTPVPSTPMNTPKSISPPGVINIPPQTRFHMTASSSPSLPRIIAPVGATTGGLSGQGKTNGGRDGNNVDEENSSAVIRLLLYECYHATYCAVKQFCHPLRAESSELEDAARRRLTEVLCKLDQVQREPVGNSNNGSSSSDGRRPKSRRADDSDDDDGGGEWPMKRRRSEAGT
ncbi:hypothetical protein PG994_005846 [Apiospora phragmitis]|uniref:Uncharacterized protein n=1 Tax=Apiospora phragmitis TaxID=2905665 RepID=A0ABR1VG49_9PEZI